MHFYIKQPQTEAEYKNYYHFRWLQLRAPWNQAEGSETDGIENQCFHIMAVDSNNKVIGVARLQFNANREAQIRYMAVAKSHQGKGVGRELVNTIEQRTKQPQADNQVCKKIVLDARETAVGFYQKLGYKITGKSYLLFDEIQHYQMEKDLRQL